MTMLTAKKVALVDTPAAVEFIQGTQRDSQKKAWLGDASQFDDPDVKNAINGAHTALAKGAETITALTSDATRSEPEKHAVGAEVSSRTVAALEQTQTTLASIAKRQADSAAEALANAFPLQPGNAFLYDRWIGFVRDEAKNGDGGYGNITAAVTKYADAATVIMRLPPPLLGIPEAQHDRWKAAAIAKHAPHVNDTADKATAIRDLAAKYTRVIGMVKTNFHNAAIAAQMATRVRLA